MSLYSDQAMISPARKQARRLASFLEEAGTITREQVETALARQRETGVRIGETLVELGMATEEDIAWALARQLGIPFVDVQSEMLDQELLATFSASSLERLQVIPLISIEGTLSMAMADPTDADAVASMEHSSGSRIDVSVATPSSILRVLRELYGLPLQKHGARKAEGHHRVTPLNEPQPEERSGVAFLASRLAAAFEGGASELHLVTSPDGLHVRRRIAGRLVPWTIESASLLPPLLSRLEALGLPQPRLGGVNHRSGCIVIPFGMRELRVDASVLVHERGTSIIFRPLGTDRRPHRLAELGLAPAGEQEIRDLLEQTEGLIVVNGRPGSGASTTLGCILHVAAGSGRRILVLVPANGRSHVDPPPGALLVTIPSRAAPSHWEELIIGHSPDVVALDDLTNGDDIALALTPALAGRIAIATTDWDDPFAMMEYLARLPRTRAAICARLRIIVAQRRVRPNGRIAAVDDQPSLAVEERLVFETLVISTHLRAALYRRASAARLRAIATQHGYHEPDPLMAELIDPGRVARASQRTTE